MSHEPHPPPGDGAHPRVGSKTETAGAGSFPSLSYRCDRCGEPARFVAPGTEEIYEFRLLKRAIPDHCFCFGCWATKYLRREHKA